jgi:hypothetical protein
MSSLVTDPRPVAVQNGDAALLVAWQHPETRRYRLLGRAVASEDGYHFEYFAAMQSEPDFRPIPGFSDPHKTYTSKVLFPLLSGRIMSASRPDRPEWLQRLELDENAAPFEILGHSFGKRVADTYEFFDEPEIDLLKGTLTFVVPVHGLRYMTSAAQEYVDRSLTKGDSLDAVAEPENVADSRAVGLWAGGHKIGFVPAPVLDYVGMLAKSGTYSARVVRRNPKSEGSHTRVVTQLVWRQDP